MTRQRKRDIRRRQRRRKKLRYLRERLENTSEPARRRLLIAKIKKLSPHAVVAEK
jgi:hypothetical protein